MDQPGRYGCHCPSTESTIPLIALLLIVGVFLGTFFLYKMIHNPLWGVTLVLMAKPFEFIFQNLGGFTIGRILGLLTTFIWIFHLTQRRELGQRFKRSTLITKLSVFVTAAVTSGLVWSLEDSGGNAIYEALTILSLSLLAVMLENLTNNANEIRLVARAMAIASVIASIPALSFVLGIDLYTPLGAESPVDISEESLRASTLGGNPNSLGISSRNGIFALLILLSYPARKLNRIWMILGIFVLLSGIFLSGSRTNFYGTFILLITIGFFSISQWLTRPRIIVGIMVLVLIGVGAYQLTPEPVRVRLLMGQGDERIASRANSRIDFTLNQQQQAIEFIKESPLFGIGMNRTYVVAQNGYAAHDTFSVVVGELGLIGLIGYLIILTWSLRMLLILILRSGNSPIRFRASIFLGMLVSMFLMGILGGFIVPYDRAFWIVLGFLPFIIKEYYAKSGRKNLGREAVV